MNDINRHKLVWGWLRLFLAFAQISLVAMAFGSLITIGPRTLTLVFTMAATAVTVSSRLLYRGRREPQHKAENQDKKSSFLR